MSATKTAAVNGISSEAVEKATGKTWPQWIKALNAAGCAKMDHKQIVEVVKKKFRIGPWWQQMVTVGYERETGLRDKHQKPSGYEFSVSKTLPASAEQIYQAWTDAKLRKKWIEENFEITTATQPKSVRIKWTPDDSRIAVAIYPKGAAKTQMTIQHAKLRDASTVARMRKYWTARVAELQAVL